MSIINPSIGIVLTSITALFTSIAILITNEYISKLKIRYTNLRNWINVYTLLHEKTLKQSLIDKKLDEKKTEELEKIYCHYLDKRSEIMKNIQSKVEDVIGDLLNKDTISTEHLMKISNFLANMM